MNVLITGGAGFIGSNFIFYLLKKYSDYRIICVDKLTYAGNLSTLASVMHYPNLDLLKWISVIEKPLISYLKKKSLI